MKSESDVHLLLPVLVFSQGVHPNQLFLECTVNPNSRVTNHNSLLEKDRRTPAGRCEKDLGREHCKLAGNVESSPEDRKDKFYSRTIGSYGRQVT